MEERVGSLEDFSLLLEGIDYVYGENCYGELALQLGMKSDKYNPEKLAIFFIGLNSLTDRTKEVIRICLDCPSELEAFILDKKTNCFITCADLKDYLRFNGWKYWEIDCCFNEIKIFLNTL